MSTSQVYWNFCACVVYRCERIAGAQVAKRASDEYLIGYQLDNELDYKTLNITYWLPMATPGGAQAAQFLAGGYNHSIAELNAAWGINASSFSDVKNHLRDELIWPAVQKGEYNYADNGFHSTPAGTDCAPFFIARRQRPVACRHAGAIPEGCRRRDQEARPASSHPWHARPEHRILGLRSPTPRGFSPSLGCLTPQETSWMSSIFTCTRTCQRWSVSAITLIPSFASHVLS